MADQNYLLGLEDKLERYRKEGKVTAFRVGDPSDPTVYLRLIGKEFDPDFLYLLREELDSHGLRLDPRSQESTYYLLSQDYPSRSSFAMGPHPESNSSQELRPGSGILRFEGGVPKGPAGTLTCFLASEDGSDIFMLAAGHVVSDFWKERPTPHPKSSIYHNPKGFPSTDSTRSIGKMIERSNPPGRYKSRIRKPTHQGPGFSETNCSEACCPEACCPEACCPEACCSEACCSEACCSEACC
ncbi:MAG TPA: hypothetical protein VGG20_25285, partial [Thermoanaerobaculia bacterium]